MRLASLLRASCLIGALAAAPGHASVPSPFTSTLPACIHTAPGGALPTTIVVRDLASNPVAHSTVWIDYANCPEFQPCPNQADFDLYTLDAVNKRFVAFTGTDGSILVSLRGGGGCAANPFRIFADGILLGSRPEASTDQNGDLVVNNVDLTLLDGKVGSSDLTGDLNCDGVIDAEDVSILVNLGTSNCAGPVPTRAPSWGKVKILYR